MSPTALRRYALRGVVVLLCLGALLDLRPLSEGAEGVPVAVLDVSRSMGGVAPELPEGARVDPEWLLVADGVQEVMGGSQPPALGRGRSRLGQALRHAASTRPGRDVLLMTDGRETEGDARAGARRVRSAGGRVFTIAPALAPADVGLESAVLVAGGAAPRVRVTAASSTSGSAEVSLVRDRVVVDRHTLVLIPGAVQTLELTDRTRESTSGSYEVVLVPSPGTPNDDTADDRLVVGLHPEQRVVVWWGLASPGDAPALPDLIVRAPRAPAASDLAGADVVVLENLPWQELGLELADGLERFVAGGGGLVLLGGPDAYAGGGWAGTALETRLAPLRVPRREGTGLGLILALDRSGSTQGARLAHLKDAVRRVLLGIVPGEQIGVLSFAGRPDDRLLGSGAIDGRDEAKRRALLGAIDALPSGGDTDLAAAILAAARYAEGMEARERRVLLLTDGDPEHPPDAAALSGVGASLRERDIRFGALVVGDDAAAAQLRTYVATTSEDVVLVDATRELPERLLHRLAQLRRRTSMLPGPGRPVALGAPPLPAWSTVVARVHDVEVAVEDGARGLYEVSVPQHAGRVFAAERAVGAGKVLGLAWGPALELGGGQAAARTALGPWVRSLAAAADRGLAATLEGEDLVVLWPAARGRGRILARGGGVPSELFEQRPGRFQGPLPAQAEAGVRVESEGRVRPLRLPSRPAPEDRGAGVDETALRDIAAAGGGRRLRAGEAPPSSPAQPGPPLAPWFLLGACILLVVDRIWARPLTPPRQP